MEGERILRELKAGKRLENILASANNYVAPLFYAEDKPCDEKTLSKLEIFSLKLFKLSLELANTSDEAIFVDLCRLSTSSLQVCAGASGGKVPPLSFEKLLLHFARLCANRGDHENVVETCRQLRTRLGRGGEEETNEGDTLLKHAFELAWKAALAVEKNAQINDDTMKRGCDRVATADVCLGLRGEAFACLLTARETNATFAVDRILRSSQRYQYILLSAKTCGNATSPARTECFQRLDAFHSALLSITDLPSLLPLPEKALLAVDYLCVLTKVAHYAGHAHRAREFLARAEAVCSILAEEKQNKGERRETADNKRTVSRERRETLERIEAALRTLINLTFALIHVDCADTDKEGTLKFHLITASREMERIMTGSADPAQLQKVWEASDELFAALERKRALLKEEGEESVTIVPRGDFPSLLSLVMSHVKLGEVRLGVKEGGVAEEHIRSSQLSALNLVTQILLHLLLLRTEGEEYPAIETPRSSKSTPPLLTPSHPPLSTPSPSSHTHTMQTLVDSCLPILTQSQSIVCSSSEGVLDDSEHRWIGNGAYNLGLVLFRMALVGEAWPVLRVATEELRTWCDVGSSDGERAVRWRETQLLQKMSLLVDCLRDSGRHDDVMETLVSTARVLPGAVLCEDGESVEMMAGMWVRGKRELAGQRPDSVLLQQWRERTLLSMLPPSHPPLSTRHRVHILTAEFSESCSRSYGGRPPRWIMAAVGNELIEVCREGGWRWDVQRGEVMIDMAISDSSLLDDALGLLEGVVSGTHHIYTPSHCHQALRHLATAHTVKATVILQNRMGSCDVEASSHDPVAGSREPLTKSRDGGEETAGTVDVCVALSSDQRRVLMDGTVEGHLCQAVERWCEWGDGEEEEGEGEEKRRTESVFYYLRLTAELCSVTRQFDLAIKSLGVLVKFYQRSPEPFLMAAYQTALARYCQLGVEWGPEIPRGAVEKSLLGAVRDEARGKGRGGSEVTASYLSSRLALASLYLHQGEIDKCRVELVGLFRDPLLSRHTVTAHILTAGTRLTAAHLLRTRHSPLLPFRQFLTRILTDQPPQSDKGEGRRVTSVELVTAAVKNLSSLSDHCGLGSKDENGSKDVDSNAILLSCGVLSRLLDALLLLSRLRLQQGSVREAVYYAREGVSLARKMALGPWYREFVAVLAQIHSARGDPLTADALLSLSPTPPPSSHTAELNAARSEAENLICQRQPSRALTVCQEAINKQTSVPSDVDRDVALAWLHLMAGRAVMEEVATSRPVLLEELWGEPGARRQRKRGTKKMSTRVLGWLLLVPEPFQQALSHFCTALQLCHPTCPPQPLREVYQWLSVVLSPYHLPLASHCLLLSSHLSLSHLATITLGKKIHKQSHRDAKHPFCDILITLQDSTEVCPDSDDPLVSARAVLCPPTVPPPLSVTDSYISSLPHGCQFTSICVAPNIISQDNQEHLLLCAVGKNRETLFVKTLIERQVMLDQFSTMLDESEESMRLREKRAWWGTRRKLDRQMKEFVAGLQTKWLGEHADIFGSPPPTSEAPTSYHMLCIGRLVQHLPWEAMPVLRGRAVGRTPSLTFSVAHHILQSIHTSGVVDPDKGYYVLNPRGDLPDTEKRFHGWFEEELGWNGVVGHAPSSTQFSEALQSHDVFVYCGHGTGREFLSTDHFKQLNCQATSLLMGCGSGRLVVGGAGDPTGMVLSYLMAGCPSLVAVLWDVTDGDIDRLSKALLESWLEGGEEDGEEEGEREVPISIALAEARSVCKLEGLNGYAAVVYGNPSIVVS